MTLRPGDLVVPSAEMPSNRYMRHVTTEGSPWRQVDYDDVMMVVSTGDDPRCAVVLHVRQNRLIDTNDVTVKWLEAV